MRHRSLAIAALLVLASAAPLAAQIQPWQNQWYWGAKGGLLRYTAASGSLNQVQVGGEWMITARHTALYAAYSTTFTQTGVTYQITSATSVPVTFDAVQRIQVALLVLPWGGNIQPYAGGGFMIETLGNANCATCSSLQTDTMLAHASGGFALAMVGLQIRVGKLAVFGQAQFSPQGRGFVLLNSSSSFEAGVRYAFLGSRESGDLSTER